MNRLQSFLQVIDHIIIQVRLQHIFYRGPVFFFYINDIRKDRRSMIPILVVMQELYAFRITFH